jgi:hypothetical protein
MNKKQEEEVKKLCNELDGLFNPFIEKYCKNCDSCCCARCFDAKGYHCLSNKKFGELTKKYKFDIKTGFLTSNGCILPRSLRSETCLRYICHFIREDLSKEVITKEYFLQEFFCSLVSDIVYKIYELRGNSYGK